MCLNRKRENMKHKNLNNMDYIINVDDLVLITGANGFIGSRVFSTLVKLGFKNFRCFIESGSEFENLKNIEISFEK